MHAFLFTGKTELERNEEIEKRLSALAVRAFDVVRMPDNPSVGIADVREFVRAIAITPLGSHTKAGVIGAIDRLTPEAQNALLKTIEEPPPNVVLFAETEVLEAVLPTIRSRFAVTSLGKQQEQMNDEYQRLLTEIIAASVGKRLQLMETTSTDRETAKSAVAALTIAARGALLSAVAAHDQKMQKKLTVLLRELLVARSQLAVNVNPRLVLDNVVIHIA